MDQKPRGSDSGLIVETYWNVRIPKELVPWLVSAGLALLTGSGLVLSSNFTGPNQIEPPVQTEVQE